MAAASGVSERYLADLEGGTGNASLIVFRRVADALKISVEDVLTTRDGPEAALWRELGATFRQLASLPPAARADVLRGLHSAMAADGAERGNRIALVGLRGAGKTTVGRLVAAQLGVAFVELYRAIERAAGMELAEIFALHGHAVYRSHELRCLEAAIAEHTEVVIATGGSLVAEPVAYDVLRRSCHVVWLKAAPEQHMARVLEQGDLRPMADHPRAMDDLRRILGSRQHLYAQARVTIDTSALTADMVSAQIVALARAGWR